MKQLEHRIIMFVIGASVVSLGIWVRMDDRYPVYDMNVGKCNQASQVYNK